MALRWFHRARGALDWNPYRAEKPTLKLADVGGHRDVKAELQKIADALGRHRRLYGRFGARSPRGVLFVGPPGVGKTYLAEALAGELRRPLFAISATELIEIFVGVGAARVRTLFSAARRVAPSFIFIDEIDAIGRTRGGATVYDASERDNTLNALLSELDGFERTEGVLVVGAARRLEVLDGALRRCGRFDLVLQLKPPSSEERAEVLAACLKRVRMASDIDVSVIQRFARELEEATQADLDSIVKSATRAAVARAATELQGRDLESSVETWKRGRLENPLESFLQSSDTGLAATNTRPRTRVLLKSGEVLEGYLEWRDINYVKLLTPQNARGVVIRNNRVASFEYVDGWLPTDDLVNGYGSR